MNAAKTAMSSKILGPESSFFAEMAVDAVTAVRTESEGDSGKKVRHLADSYSTAVLGRAKCRQIQSIPNAGWNILKEYRSASRALAVRRVFTRPVLSEWQSCGKRAQHPQV